MYNLCTNHSLVSLFTNFLPTVSFTNDLLYVWVFADAITMKVFCDCTCTHVNYFVVVWENKICHPVRQKNIFLNFFLIGVFYNLINFNLYF